MSLSRLLPKSAAKKSENKLDDALYLIMVDWGWSWRDIKETPLPIILRLFKAHERREKQKRKQQKRKK